MTFTLDVGAGHVYDTEHGLGNVVLAKNQPCSYGV